MLYELEDSNGRVIAYAEDAWQALDAAVLRQVRTGKGSRVVASWQADGRWGFAGPIRKVRFGVDDGGQVWRVDDSGVPATMAASAALYIDATYRAAQDDYQAGSHSRHSRKV